MLPYTVYLLSPLMFISASDKKDCATLTNTAKKRLRDGMPIKLQANKYSV